MAVEREYRTIVNMDDPDLIAWRREATTELDANPGDKVLDMLIDAANAELDARAAEAWGASR